MAVSAIVDECSFQLPVRSCLAVQVPVRSCLAVLFKCAHAGSMRTHVRTYVVGHVVPGVRTYQYSHVAYVRTYVRTYVPNSKNSCQVLINAG